MERFSPRFAKPPLASWDENYQGNNNERFEFKDYKAPEGYFTWGKQSESKSTRPKFLELMGAVPEFNAMMKKGGHELYQDKTPTWVKGAVPTNAGAMSDGAYGVNPNISTGGK